MPAGQTPPYRIASLYQYPPDASEKFIETNYTRGAPGRVKVDKILAREVSMPKFVIEREIPGAGKMTPSELHAAAQKSVATLKELGPNIQWLQSFVTDDRLYCVYLASDEELIKTHAAKSGFPASRISAVRSLIDPSTAE